MDINDPKYLRSTTNVSSPFENMEHSSDEEQMGDKRNRSTTDLTTAQKTNLIKQHTDVEEKKKDDYKSLERNYQDSLGIIHEMKHEKAKFIDEIASLKARLEVLEGHSKKLGEEKA